MPSMEGSGGRGFGFKGLGVEGGGVGLGFRLLLKTLETLARLGGVTNQPPEYLGLRL